MKDPGSHGDGSRGDGVPAGADGPPEEGALGAERRAEIDEKLETLRRKLDALLFSKPEIPEARKYTYAEAAIRLKHGVDPARLEEGEHERLAETSLSKKVIGRLTRDGDCPLDRVKIGGSTYVTEKSIRAYEKGVALGYVDGYQVPEPRNYAKSK